MITNPSVADSGSPLRRKRMEWVDGTEIAVCRTGGLKKRIQVLTILSHSNDGERSSAMVSPVNFHGSGWCIHPNYFGVYPASAFHVSGRKIAVAGDIPTVQKLEQHPDDPRYYEADLVNHGYMYAISSPRFKNIGKILDFRPLINTFVFKIYSPAENYMAHKLTSVTLSSEQKDIYFAGSFKAWLNPKTGRHVPLKSGDVRWGSNFISAYFGQRIQLGRAPEEATVLNLIAIPMRHTQMRLTLRFENGVTRRISLKKDNEWISSSDCKMLVFENMSVPAKIDNSNRQSVDLNRVQTDEE